MAAALAYLRSLGIWMLEYSHFDSTFHLIDHKIATEPFGGRVVFIGNEKRLRLYR